MLNADSAVNMLAAMVNDVGSGQLFEKGGPLCWLSLSKTYAAITKAGAVTEKQCQLIEQVRRQYVELKGASKRFQRSSECQNLLSALEHIQRSKPKMVSPQDRSRSQRLSQVVHSLIPGGVVHIGHFEEAERGWPSRNRLGAGGTGCSALSRRFRSNPSHVECSSSCRFATRPIGLATLRTSDMSNVSPHLP